MKDLNLIWYCAIVPPKPEFLFKPFQQDVKHVKRVARPVPVVMMSKIIIFREDIKILLLTFI